MQTYVGTKLSGLLLLILFVVLLPIGAPLALSGSRLGRHYPLLLIRGLIQLKH